MPSDLTAIIVTWNSGEVTFRCLEALLHGQEVVPRLVVVDNGSAEGLADQLAGRFGQDPGFSLLRNQDNRGFPRAVNQGLEAVTTPYVLMVNPDIVLAPGALDLLFAALREDYAVGLVGPKVRLPNGRIQYQCARRLPSPLHLVTGRLGLSRAGRWVGLSDQLMSDWDHAGSREVECLSGACLLLRTADLRRVGGLVEEMYLEDMELCWRVRAVLGKRVWYCAEAEATHFHSTSFHAITDRRHYLWAVEQVDSAPLKFLARHAGGGALAAARAAFVLSGVLKLLALGVAWPLVSWRGPLRRAASSALLRSYVRLLVGLRGPRFGPR